MPTECPSSPAQHGGKVFIIHHAAALYWLVRAIEHKKGMMLLERNKFCQIEIQGVTYNCVEHIPSGHKAIFDNDNKYIKAIQEFGSAFNMSNGILWFVDQETKKFISLATFLYAQYSGKPLHEVRQFKTRHMQRFIDENRMIEDCRKDNLFCSGYPTDVTSNRVIRRIGTKYFSIEVVSKGIVEYFSYDDGLYNLLSTPNNFSYSATKQNRVQATFRTEDGKPCYAYTGIIANAYREGRLSKDNFRRVLVDILQDADKPQLDHLNSDYHNHCNWNLSTMDRSLNIAKSHYTDAFPPPYQVFYAVNSEGEYLIEFIHPQLLTGRLVTTFYKCATAKDVIDWLKFQYGAANSLTHNTKIQILSGTEAKTYQPVLTALKKPPKIGRDIRVDMEHAEKLLALDTVNFRTWVPMDRPNIGQIPAILSQFLG